MQKNYINNKHTTDIIIVDSEIVANSDKNKASLTNSEVLS